MYIILDVLVKLLAPMTVFTAEEIWNFMPHKKDESTQSPMLTSWPNLNEEYNNKELVKKWNKIEKIKELVAKKLEIARTEKVIGHSLNAKVTLYAEGENYKFLKEVEEHLQPVLIVSQVFIEENARKDENEKNRGKSRNALMEKNAKDAGCILQQ